MMYFDAKNTNLFFYLYSRSYPGFGRMVVSATCDTELVSQLFDGGWTSASLSTDAASPIDCTIGQSAFVNKRITSR